MLDFLLLILFTFVSLCPYNAASTKYPYPVSAFFFRKMFADRGKPCIKGKNRGKSRYRNGKKKACPEEKSRGARPSVITRTCNQPQVLYQ